MLIWRAHLWLVVVPASVAFLNLSPWTGWIVFDEFDLVLLGTLAVGYLHGVRTPHQYPNAAMSRRALSLLFLLGCVAVCSLSRAMQDAGGFHFDWFAGYTDALNSVRVVKSEFYALLCVPLLQREFACGPTLAHRRMALGMVMGLGIATLAVLWERLAFATLLDFSSPYRTVALFWEMHVGGEAIDAYLALATPFAMWALVSARRPFAWLCAATLTILTAYAVLTTFSRGLYGAVLTSLLVLAVVLLGRRSNPSNTTGWRRIATVLLALTLTAEAAMVLGGGTYMLERMARSQDDLGSRVIHWQRGIAMLQGPADWWLGKGPGRLPSHFANLGSSSEFSGQVLANGESNEGALENRYVTVIGPKTQSRLGGQFALTQRVEPPSQGAHQVIMDVRARTDTDLQFEWCQRHLLYDAGCQTAHLHLDADPAWRHLAQPLVRAPVPTGHWYAPPLGLFAVSVVNAGGVADIDNIHLQGPKHEELLANGDFADGLAHWLACAQSYYEPWHIDNLLLELLIERGLLGLLSFSLLAAIALWHAVRESRRSPAHHPFICAALVGVLCVGMTGSVMDVPRVMFLVYWMVLQGAFLMSCEHAASTEMRKIKLKTND